MAVKNITVLGSGVMGHGIAQVSATAGYNVVLRDIKQEFLDKAMEKIKWSLDKLVSKEKISKEEGDSIFSRITPIVDLNEAVKNAELIIRELGKLSVELAITTNAVIVDRFIDVFKEAGIKSVNVSLDSLKEDCFNDISRRNYFKQIKQNIDLLIANDFNVKINAVVIRGVNETEITDFVEWSRKENVHVRFIEFMPFDGNNWNTEKKVSFKEILEDVENTFGKAGFYKIEDQPNDTARNFRMIGGKGTFGIISSVTNPFCDTCNRIRLTADGKIKNCLFSEDESDLLSAYRRGESIEDKIRRSFALKHKERGGLSEFSNEEVRKHKNRSMTSIGG